MNMNESNCKEIKDDKCLSFALKSNCAIKEKISEHKNGFVNNVVKENGAVKKRKKKKSQRNNIQSEQTSVHDEHSVCTCQGTYVCNNCEKSTTSCDIDENQKSLLFKLPNAENDSCDLKVSAKTLNESKSQCTEKECVDKLPTQISDSSDCVISEGNESLRNELQNLNISEDKSSDNICVTKLPKIDFVQYESELQMPMIMKIIQKDLSEPYSIYTYRYFIHNWPKLCFLAMCGDKCVGAIVCKLDMHRKVIRRGYIAMLAVDQNYRKLHIGSTLVEMAINEMIAGDADEIVLETEVTNKPALKLYEKLGFVRDKRLFRYYLNGVDALRLKLWLR